MKILNTQAYTFWLLVEAVLISITILFIPFGILGICFRCWTYFIYLFRRINGY